MAITTKRQAKRSFAGFLGANEGDRPEAPANTADPAITGTAQVGETLKHLTAAGVLQEANTKSEKAPANKAEKAAPKNKSAD